ncbi:4'-phosphopantetheinyl transferase family protein [Anaerophaga thermohalophila]|uniref:4'-phosphopantetheinyl transferase family protein n=1 Tax=Anaerophaga thermohalophila TaxID=177400 RepID=UPI000237CF93|nr:4'-phosphopantetheinyl transferase superfamily protein [Anaerophaga thermohalophila]MDI3520904.1 4-phosphopantetheinyl transferase [Anaerophaga sp.]
MPIVFENENSHQTRVAVWKITESEEALKLMLPPLKKNETDFLQSISFAPRRKEWLASRVLIYRLTGLYPETRYMDNGQPFVTNCRENISISHTRSYAAIVLTNSFMPGIDIEYPSDRIRKVSKRFLNPHEKKFIKDPFTEVQLGLIWCSKEAIFKTAGIPGLVFKDHIIISPFTPVHQQGSINASLSVSGSNKTIYLNYVLDKNFYLVWTK